MSEATRELVLILSPWSRVVLDWDDWYELRLCFVLFSSSCFSNTIGHQPDGVLFRTWTSSYDVCQMAYGWGMLPNHESRQSHRFLCLLLDDSALMLLSPSECTIYGYREKLHSGQEQKWMVCWDGEKRLRKRIPPVLLCGWYLVTHSWIT